MADTRNDADQGAGDTDARTAGGKRKGGAKPIAGRLPQGRGALALGAVVAGGVALVAALFAGKRTGKADDSGGHAFADDQGDPLAGVVARSSSAGELAGGATTVSALDSEDALHRLGTPATVPVDAMRSYTGDHAPDMALDYVPGDDQGSGSAPRGQ